MACLIVNSNFQVHMENTDKTLSVMLDRPAAPGGKPLKSSALQSPEINRLNLTALLRQARKKAGQAPATRNYWVSFIKGVGAHSANSNAADA